MASKEPEMRALLEWVRRQSVAGKSFEGIEDPWLHHMDPADLSDDYKSTRAELAQELRQEAAVALDEWKATGNPDAMRAQGEANEMASKLETMARPLPAPEPTLKRHPVSGEWIVVDIDPVNPKTVAHDDMFSGLARTVRGLPKNLKNVIPLGVMAKILGGGAAKAAGPGAEALLFAGHEKPNIREALAADADMLAGAMGLPTGYQDPTAINREDAATLEAAIEGARRRNIDIRGKASYRTAYPEGVRTDPDSPPLSPDQLENYLALRAEAARSGRPMGTPRETRPTVEMTGRQ